MNKVLIVLTGLLALVTLAPLSRSHSGWIRVWDFPRLQIGVMALINLILTVVFRKYFSASTRGWLLLCNAIIALYQAGKVYRYTPFFPCEAIDSRLRNPGSVFSLMVSNVLMDNRKVDEFLGLVQKADPDILLINEPNRWWETHLEILDAKYPFHVKVPLDNTYGMILYSRFPLFEPRVHFLVRDYVPSIHALVELPSGSRVQLYCVHPEPPNEAQTHNRDGELLMVGKKAAESEYPCVVAGDLNDVAWSRSTRLFQKISQTVDPRIGRGFFNTYNAKIPLVRYSLDHIFYSPSLTLVELRRLSRFGSDHFPILIRLEYDPECGRRQSPPTPTSEEIERVNHVIEKAK